MIASSSFAVPGQRVLDYGNLVNQCAPLNRGLAGWWVSLPQLRGGPKLFDIAGRNHGTLTNGPLWTGGTGRPGGRGALSFDGSDDYVSIGDPPSLNVTTGPCTLMAWVNLGTQNGSNKGGAFIGRANDNAPVTRTISLEVVCGLGNQGKIQFQAYDGTSNPFVITSASLENAGWTHAVGVRDGTNLLLYINGASIGSAADTSGDLSGSGLTWAIGQRRDSDFGTNVTGQIDDVRVWLRALSASEVAMLYSASRTGYSNELNRISRADFLNQITAATTGTPILRGGILQSSIIRGLAA